MDAESATAVVAQDCKTESRNLRARILSGSFILLAGSGLVSGLNFAYNIAVARFLGPTGFGHASVVYTLLILISAVTLSFQIVTAKVVAKQGSLPDQNGAYRGFHRSAWGAGISVALLLVLAQKLVASYLNLPNSTLIVLLAVGVGFYVPLGTRRGYLQGICGFNRLAANLVLEAFCRLSGSLLMVVLGFGVTGVIAANAAAVGIAYLSAIPSLPGGVSSRVEIPDAFREALQAIVFFVGQVIINNCDIVLVKHFFAATPAGLYAAVALVGRVIFAFSWAVVNSMFPIVAGARNRERKDHSVLGTSLFMVFGICTVFALALGLAPASVWARLFGPAFFIAGKNGLPHLLALYAAATGLYSLSVVMIAYEMSYKIANTGWMQLAFSGVLIAGIYRFHSSLQEVIWVQIVLMGFLFVVVAVPYLVNAMAGFRNPDPDEDSEYGAIRKLRPVSEDEVMSEFLKNDFQNPDFEDYRETLSNLVNQPNLADPVENAKRRALLFIRHGSLWRVLPDSTQWFEVSLRPADLQRIRAFPRAHWRKLAKGDFAITEIVREIGAGRCHDVVEEEFLTKILDIRNWLEQDIDAGAVLLIGVTDKGPFTVLDGNHRLAASLLASTEPSKRFRVYCGLSPRMSQCCWYNTNVSTLFRYAGKKIRQFMRDPVVELERLLQSS